MNPAIIAMIRASGRSWWQARYSNGRVLSEWETLSDKIRLPVGSSRTSRWEEVPKKRMVGLRLLCPNGMAGELEASEGYKFFQLKVGRVDVPVGVGGESAVKQATDAHIIGVVADAEGNCLCRAWEYAQWGCETWRFCWECHAAVNTEFCKCGQDLRGIAPVDRARLKTKMNKVLLRPARLIEFRDNIFNMKYENLGKLKLDVQQLKV